MPRIIAKITPGPNESWRVSLGDGSWWSDLEWNLNSARSIVEAYRYGRRGNRIYRGMIHANSHGPRRARAIIRLEKALKLHGRDCEKVSETIHQQIHERREIARRNRA